MDLKEILTIAGQPGLFKFVAQGAKGVIVEAIADGKRQSVPGNARVSSLGEIALFTDAEDLPLDKVFERFHTKYEGKETISHKSTPEQMKAVFEQVIPEYDRDNVKVSDMKKVITWYNIIVSNNLYSAPVEETETAE